MEPQIEQFTDASDERSIVRPGLSVIDCWAQARDRIAADPGLTDGAGADDRRRRDGCRLQLVMYVDDNRAAARVKEVAV
jgi:hypothetical protein